MSVTKHHRSPRPPAALRAPPSLRRPHRRPRGRSYGGRCRGGFGTFAPPSEIAPPRGGWTPNSGGRHGCIACLAWCPG